MIQTFNPDHYSIQKAKDQDFIGFYREESEFRRALNYPPFSRLINFRLVGNSERRTKAVSEEMGSIGQDLLKRGYGKGMEILGPCASPFAKIRT